MSTAIYYLLGYDRPDGLFHMNKSFASRSHLCLIFPDLGFEQQTYHVLHQGRAEYTLITPVPGGPPKIEIKVMGIGPGEHRQLLVGTGIWKKSRILPEDIALGKSAEDKDRVGCLITEVVVPGFHWEDHVFMTKQKLEDLFRGVEGGESYIAAFEGYVKKD